MAANGEPHGAVVVAADTEEEMPPESEEQALALNVEELRYWVTQVVIENINLEKELEERKAARRMAAEICQSGKPLILTGSTTQHQAFLPNGNANTPKKKKRKTNGLASDVLQGGQQFMPDTHSQPQVAVQETIPPTPQQFPPQVTQTKQVSAKSTPASAPVAMGQETNISAAPVTQQAPQAVPPAMPQGSMPLKHDLQASGQPYNHMPPPAQQQGPPMPSHQMFYNRSTSPGLEHQGQTHNNRQGYRAPHARHQQFSRPPRQPQAHYHSSTGFAPHLPYQQQAAMQMADQFLNTLNHRQ